MASALLSSSPRGSDFSGTHPLNSSPLKLQSHHSDELELQDGEISPSFDASFASNLSFNNSDNGDSPGGMDFSPAAPPKPRSPAPITNARARVLDRAKTYDSSFFSQLTTQKRPSLQVCQRDPAKQSAPSPVDRPRVFGAVLDANASRSDSAPSPSKQQQKIPSRPPLVKKTQSEAILQLQVAPQSRNTTHSKRPSLQRTRGHAASASTSMLDFVKNSRPSTAPPLASQRDATSKDGSRHIRANSDVSSSCSWSFSQPSLQVPPPNPRSASDPQTSTCTSTTFAIPEESPSLDQMDIDSPPLPPDNYNNAMELDDMSFEALSPNQPSDGFINPPALMSILKQTQQADFGDFFAASPTPQSVQARESAVSVKEREKILSSNRKRSFDADQSFELSSEDASPSSPLAQIQVPARPNLQKAASVACTMFPTLGVTRRRPSDRSNATSGRGSISSMRALSSGQSSRRTSFDNSPPRDDRVQLQKKARGESMESSTLSSRLSQARRSESLEGRDDRRSQGASTLNKAAQQSIGLGLPPPARSSMASEILSRPRHITSASESHMTFALPKRRVASDSAAKVMPPETRMESDGKRLPCHQVADDGLMRIKAETVSDLMEGKYDQIIERFVIVDCRFSFEYEGGHVDGAVNIQDEQQLADYFLSPGQGFLEGGRNLPTPCVSDDPGAKPVIIFHCEFSQKRAPAIAGCLRKLDRARGHEYPNVHYPEIYILAGGYAELFKNHSHLCQPRAYVPMLKSSQGESAYDKFACRTKPGFNFTRAKSFSALEHQMLAKRSDSRPSSSSSKDAKLKAPAAARSAIAIQEDDHENTADSSTSSSPGGAEASPCPGQGRAARKPLGHVRVPSRPLYRSVTTTVLPQNSVQRPMFSFQ